MPRPSSWSALLIGVALAFAGGVLALLVHATTESTGVVIVLMLLGCYMAGMWVMRRGTARYNSALIAWQRNGTPHLKEIWPRRLARP